MNFLPKFRCFYTFVGQVKYFFRTITNDTVSRLYTLISGFKQYIKLRASFPGLCIAETPRSRYITFTYTVGFCLWLFVCLFVCLFTKLFCRSFILITLKQDYLIVLICLDPVIESFGKLLDFWKTKKTTHPRHCLFVFSVLFFSHSGVATYTHLNRSVLTWETIW